MTAEQRLKTVIGEQVFQICILQEQLDQANERLAGAIQHAEQLTGVIAGMQQPVEVPPTKPAPAAGEQASEGHSELQS